MLTRAAALIVLLAASLAHAEPAQESMQSTQDADRERAANHAHVAQLLYARADYAGALKEFEAARLILALPELDYDVAQCLAHLGRNAEAADTFERYIAARPDDPNNEQTRARIVELRKAASPTPDPASNAVAAAPPRKKASVVAPAVVAGFTGASLIVGAALVGHVGADLSGRADHCCSQSLADGLKHQAYAGYAFFGVAGALAIVDVALWVRWARGRTR